LRPVRDTFRRRAWIEAILCAVLLAEGLLALPVKGQEKPISNPVHGNWIAIKEGSALFRANCSPCHGLHAQGGGRGPDLTTNRWAHGSNDGDVFRTITRGVPGTEMPANGFEDSETWAIIAYLRSLAPPSSPTVPGDRVKGEKIFSESGCSICHMVKGHGGLLGPDLSRVGASRSVSYLVDSIREPSKELSAGMLDPNNHYGLPLVYGKVTVITASGQEITGVAKNEDTFSIQLLDTDQNLHLLLKKDLKEVVHNQISLMPVYSEDRITPAELQDLVAYLERLRGN
jgi:cytochrome c oxidase cbb3-type subunit III